LRGKTQKQLEQIAAGFDGVMGLAAKDLTTGETFTVNPDMVFPQASSIKIPVLLELYRQAQTGTLQLTEKVEVKKAHGAGGSGVLQHFSDGGSTLALRDLAVLMIVLSDNTATNILIDRVGMSNVNDMLARANLRQTRLQRKMIDLEAGRAGRENLSTPAEMIWLLGLLHQGKLLDAAHTALVIEILKYPKNTALRRGLPANVELAGKPGGLAGVSCESGIVLLAGKPYALSVMTTYAGPQAAAEEALAEVSRRVFAYFERLARSNALGVRLPPA
jgi:beta-lactamase class A